jgi:hypothetical protein
MKKKSSEFLTRETQGLIPNTIVYIPAQYVHKSEKPFVIQGRDEPVYGNMLTVLIYDGAMFGKAGAQPLAIKELSYNQLRRQSFGPDVTEVEMRDTTNGIRGALKANVSNIKGIAPKWGFQETGVDADGDPCGEYYLKESYAFKVGERRNYAFPILEESASLWNYKTREDDDRYLELEFLSLAELFPINVNEQWLKPWERTAMAHLDADYRIDVTEEATDTEATEDTDTEDTDTEVTTDAETEEAANDATTEEVADAPAEASKKKKA